MVLVFGTSYCDLPGCPRLWMKKGQMNPMEPSGTRWSQLEEVVSPKPIAVYGCQWLQCDLETLAAFLFEIGVGSAPPKDWFLRRKH